LQGKKEDIMSVFYIPFSKTKRAHYIAVNVCVLTMQAYVIVVENAHGAAYASTGPTVFPLMKQILPNTHQSAVEKVTQIKSNTGSVYVSPASIKDKKKNTNEKGSHHTCYILWT
jgi:predicted sugar kinase